MWSAEHSLRHLFSARFPVPEEEMGMWVPITLHPLLASRNLSSQGMEGKYLGAEQTWGCSISPPAWL